MKQHEKCEKKREKIRELHKQYFEDYNKKVAKNGIYIDIEDIEKEKMKKESMKLVLGNWYWEIGTEICLKKTNKKSENMESNDKKKRNKRGSLKYVRLVRGYLVACNGTLSIHFKRILFSQYENKMDK